MIKHTIISALILFFFNNVVFGAQHKDVTDIELLKPLTHVRSVLSSYATLQKQVSMGYVEGIYIINNIHRRVLSYKYRTEPIRIECKNLVTSHDKTVYSKISYENGDDAIIVVDDTYVMSGTLNPSMLNQMPSNISMRTIMPARKRLKDELCADVIKKPILYEFYAKNRLSYWVAIENNVPTARLLPSIEGYENISTAVLSWEKYIGLPAKTYLRLKDDREDEEGIIIHLADAEWDKIMQLHEQFKGFGIEIISQNKKKQYFIISGIGIHDSEKFGNNRYYFRELNATLSAKQKKEDTCMQQLDRFLTRHESKISVAIALFALFFLYKYHSCLFFGITH